MDGAEATPDVVNLLISHLHKLCKSNPDVLSEAFRVQLASVRERMDAFLRSDTDESTDYPLPSDMFLFALIGILFSTSDHFHLVATPAMLLMEKHLAQLSPTSLGELVSKSFILSVFLKVHSHFDGLYDSRL